MSTFNLHPYVETQKTNHYNMKPGIFQYRCVRIHEPVSGFEQVMIPKVSLSICFRWFVFFEDFSKGLFFGLTVVDSQV